MRATLVLVGALVGGGCAANALTLRSTRYQVTVPAGWDVDEASLGDDPAVLRVPAATSDPQAHKLELRIYAWEARASGRSPIEEVVSRLAGAHEREMRSAGVARAEACSDVTRQYPILGEPRRGARLRAHTGHHVTVTAAQAAGSLVAVVGFVPEGDHFCENLAAIEAAMVKIADQLVAIDFDPTPPNQMLSPADLQAGPAIR